MIAVTSFSAKGYEVYGKKFLESAVQYFPGSILVYYEEKPDFEHDKIIYKPLFDVHGIKAFLEYCDRNPVFHGRVNGSYDYNYNAYKFSKKVFAQFDALQHYAGKIFWFDADCVLQKQIPVQFLEDVFEGKTLAVLWREGLYTETGFVGFDTHGSCFDYFLKNYIDVYRKGILFSLPGWHDCWALDHAVKESLVPYNNLSPDYPKKGINVMPHSILGEYVIHNKGNRKYK